MGIDGNNTVRLIRKKSAKAVKEFKELANYLNEVFAVLEDGGTSFVIGYDAVEVELDVRDDRDFLFNRCIAETVLQMKPVKCREDLKFIPDGDSDWGGRLVSICKKYDCWLESSSWHDSNVEAHQYGGFRLKVVASLNTIAVPFSIDISTGDAITPAPSDYYFKSVFDDNALYRLKAYTIETVIAEKLEAILSLGNVSTRPRDYYDAYMLTTAIKFNIRKLRLALKATIAHRGSLDAVRAWKSVLNGISASSVMNERWRKYQREFPFAADVDFDRICKQLGALFSKVL